MLIYHILQFYVIGNPSDMLGARTIAPRGGVMAGGAGRAVSSSSERRRATHNEVICNYCKLLQMINMKQISIFNRRYKMFLG